MQEFNTSLVREKFVITDVDGPETADRTPIVALSNRMAIPLESADVDLKEHLIIRAQNMHTCVRLAAHLTRDFQENGPILTRAKPYDWEFAYISITKGFEKKWNPQRWIAVYARGRLIYEAGEGMRHPFLDIIEQCDARNKGDYEQSIVIARDAFRQAGRAVKIEHDTNVGLIVNIRPGEGKCGIMIRSGGRPTTLNFTAKAKAGRAVKPSQCLSAAAAFLEGVQMAYIVGMTRKKLQFDLIETFSPDAKQGEEAAQKLARLRGAIDQFENLLEVSYRPGRPDFSELVTQAETRAQAQISRALKQQAESGNRKDWVG